MFFGNESLATGLMGIVNMSLLIFGILIAWYALQIVRWEVFLKEAKGRRAAVLRLLIAIVIGYQLARFVNDYLLATTMLRQVF